MTSDLGLHCLLGSFRLNIEDFYGIFILDIFISFGYNQKVIMTVYVFVLLVLQCQIIRPEISPKNTIKKIVSRSCI